MLGLLSTNLNTSYVNVEHCNYNHVLPACPNLNTSYVNVEPEQNSHSSIQHIAEYGSIACSLFFSPRILVYLKIKRINSYTQGVPTCLALLRIKILGQILDKY